MARTGRLVAADTAAIFAHPGTRPTAGGSVVRVSTDRENFAPTG